MLDSNPIQNYSNITTTLDSKKEGRLKVDTAGMKKKKKEIIKKFIKPTWTSQS